MDQSEKPVSEHNPLVFLAGCGDMGERTRTFDWSKTPIGPVESWPPSLNPVDPAAFDKLLAGLKTSTN
jgi:hypothetical protein